jgi:predicted nucleic acid-binding protein
MKVAFDTNVLAYAEGVNDAERHRVAVRIIERLAPETAVIPVQVLGELFNALTRRGGMPREYARDRITRWRSIYSTVDTSADTLTMAANLAADNKLQIWDAVVISAASEAGCHLLLSEDMQDGFSWGGVTVVNPFAENPNPLLMALLHSPDR